jgi:glutamate/tyrosine decarboxylase-like PLP-dependent enzyme
VDPRDWLGPAVEAIADWERSFGPFDTHPAQAVPDAQMTEAFGRLTSRLRDNYPYFHPRYAGQMLKPPHPVAVVGYLAGMLVNPNNHALDGGPATAAMEREVIADLAGMFGLPDHLGHLTSSGTIANLEALYVARETHPGRGIACSDDAHYTHRRMCHLLGMPVETVPTDARGRMESQALEEVLRTGRIGTVVLTAGTTGVGAVDAVDEAIPLARRYGARVHVDAAYGGFFRLIADEPEETAVSTVAGEAGVRAAPFTAIGQCDSVVVDPHKHGLQPYGCGAVLFADPAVARFYDHDSPYTYFTADGGHLGEISLECSRSGAAAAALWLTLQVFPLTPDGLGRLLRPGRQAALRWAQLLAESPLLAAYQQPDLDIVTYLARKTSAREVDRCSAAILTAGMADRPDEAVYLATYTTDPAALAARGHRIAPDTQQVRILRSVLMKPESLAWADRLFARIEGLANRSAERSGSGP